MGYTHYWSVNKIPNGMASLVEARYQKAIKQCQRIAIAYQKEFGGLSGYSAHTELGKYGGLLVNGKGEDSHEDFSFREYFSQNTSSFCKTARKPYDECVTACLIVMKHYLKDLINVSSDGLASDWEYGLFLAIKYLKLKSLSNPIKKNRAAA